MQRYFDVVQTTSGDAIPGALVYVYVGSTTVLATLFSDNGVTAAPNPLTTNADGEYAFYAANGTYTIQIAATGYAGETKPGVVLFDPSDSGASNNVQFLQAGTGAQVRSVQSKLRDVVSALDFAVDPTGDTDCTTAMQTFLNAAAGKRAYLPAGTYMVNQGLVIKSNTLLQGDGDGTVIKANPSYVGVNGGTYATQTCQMLRNENFAASSLTDSDISITNLTFDWGAVTISGGGAHSISLRYVNRVTIQNVRSINGENCTALLACRDTLTSGCHAQNAKNCGFDHWDGSNNCIVAFCTVRNAGTVGSSAQGIQFTGTGTFNENRTSADCLVIGCSVYGIRDTGSSSAIISNANDAGSSTYRFRSIGNYIENCDLGIVFEGQGGQHLSIGDTLRNVDNLPIFVQLVSPNSSSHCRVLDAHLIDCNHSVINVALVQLSGADNSVRGLRVTNTTSAAYNIIVWLTTGAVNNIVEIEKADTGSGVRIFDQGTNTYVADEPYMAWQQYTPDISTTSGSITSSIKNGRFIKVGRRVHFSASVNITNNGTGAGILLISLPITAQSANSAFGVGRDSTVGTLCLWHNGSTTDAYVQTTGGTYPGATGSVINISGVYECF